MSKLTEKKSGKDAIANFVPATGNESYIHKTRTKEQLDLDANAINLMYNEGINLARRATATMIRAGERLLLVRTHFTSDVKFGVWRKENIEFSQSHTQRLMAVAKEFGDTKDAELLPIGTLAELLPASPALKKEVIKEAKEGKKPTRAEVTERKKAEKDDSPPESAEDFEDSIVAKTPKKDKSVAPPKEYTEEQVAQHTLDKPLKKRLSQIHAEDYTQACLVFGIPPFHDGRPSEDMIQCLYDGYLQPDLNQDFADRLEAAFDLLMEIY